jgi:hypothetical protein
MEQSVFGMKCVFKFCRQLCFSKYFFSLQYIFSEFKHDSLTETPLNRTRNGGQISTVF